MVSIPIGFSSSLQPHRDRRGEQISHHVSIPIGFSSSLQLSRRAGGATCYALFQSLSGFQVRCNAIQCPSVLDLVRVSIPIGFSSSLQRPGLLAVRTPIIGFNPYRVFKFVATYIWVNGDTATGLFQSLSGFQVRCNLTWQRPLASDSPGFNPYRVFKFVATPMVGWTLRLISGSFQSLSGFQVRCNTPGIPEAQPRWSVSIPIGFSSSLQHPGFLVSDDQSIRFNPYRVFKFVATLAFVGSLRVLIGFNPYRVFKFVATLWVAFFLSRPFAGFNPYRVFKFVATPRTFAVVRSNFSVSIPIGFSSSLQLTSKGKVKKGGSFNPYRVFKFVATESDIHNKIIISMFQSLSGFQVRCNSTTAWH